MEEHCQEWMAAGCISRALCVLSLQTEQTVYWTPCSAKRIKCVNDEHKDPYVSHQCWPFAAKLIIALEMLLRMVPASGCWFCVKQERKLRGGIRWEVMKSCWNGTQIQKLIVFEPSQRGVLSCLRFPVLRRSVLWGRHTMLCVVRGVHQAVYVVHILWESRQDSQVKSMQTVSWREEPCFCNSWKKCFELWRIPSVTVSAPVHGAQFCIFQSYINEMYFLGLPHVTQHCQAFWAIN